MSETGSILGNRRTLMIVQILGLGIIAVAVVVAVLSSRSASGPAEIAISEVWARATPGGADTAAVYLTIANGGGTADALVTATTPAAGSVMIHQTAIANDIATMTEMSAGVSVPAGGTVTFAPNGSHLMLMDLPAPLAEGDTFPITLNFEDTGPVEATVTVLGAAAAGPGG